VAGADEEMQKQMYTLEMYRMQAESLARQLEMVRLTREDHVRARDTIASFMEKAEGDEVLIPIGADSFVHAKVAKPDKALVGVGSTYAVENNSKKGLEMLDRKLEDIQKAEAALTTNIEQIEQSAAALSAQLEREYGDTMRAQE